MYKLTEQPEFVAKSLSSSEARELFMGINLKPLKYFVPTGKQEEYIEEIGLSTKESTIPVVVYAAGNGTGKTTATIETVLNIIYGAQNAWYEYPMFQNWQFPKLCWYCSTADALRNKIIPLFESLALPGTIESFKDGKTFTARMVFPKQDWVISFKTYEQEPSTYESADVGLICLDEPAPQPVWNAIKSRRRLGALTLISMTPLFTPPYLYDEVKKSYEQGIKGYHYIEADVYSACKERGIRGYLNPHTVDEWVSTCDPEEIEARVYGKFAYFSQLIYPNLNRNLHFVDPLEYPIPDHSVIKQVVDPHDSRPPACIYAALCPNNRIIIFDETPSDKSVPFWEMKQPTTVKTDIQEWKRIEDRYTELWSKCSMVRIMDRIFGWQMRGKRTFAEMYYNESQALKCKMDFYKSYEVEGGFESEIHYGHKEVRKALLPIADGKPGLVIWNTCYHTWNGLTHYVRKHETTKSAADKPAQSGKIIEKYKCFPDLVRYLVCDDVTPEMPVAPKTKYDKVMEKVYSKDNYDKDELYD